MPVRSFSLHIIHFLGILIRNKRFFDKYQHISLSLWSDNWHGSFQSMVVETLQIIDTSPQGNMVRKSTNIHSDAWLCCLPLGKLVKARSLDATEIFWSMLV